jgi:uncharacterized damage-inducible protein DinB
VSTILKSLFDHKAWADTELLGAVGAMDASAHAESRHTAIRILNHIHTVDKIFLANVSGEKHAFTATNTPETPSIEALSWSTLETDRAWQDYVARLSANDLMQSISFRFTDGDKGSMTREEMLHHVLAHGAYHRGAVGRLVAQTGAAPPRDLFTKFLHTTEPLRRG